MKKDKDMHLNSLRFIQRNGERILQHKPVKVLVPHGFELYSFPAEWEDVPLFIPDPIKKEISREDLAKELGL